MDGKEKGGYYQHGGRSYKTSMVHLRWIGMEKRILINTISRNLFCLMLLRLNDGGSALWTFKSSLIPVWFFYLEKLNKIFKKVRLMIKFPERSQVYALCEGFVLNDFATKWLQELQVEIDENICEKWTITDVNDITSVYESFKQDLHEIWSARMVSLKRSRIRAIENYKVVSFTNCKSGDNEYSQISSSIASCGMCLTLFVTFYALFFEFIWFE